MKGFGQSSFLYHLSDVPWLSNKYFTAEPFMANTNYFFRHVIRDANIKKENYAYYI